MKFAPGELVRLCTRPIDYDHKRFAIVIGSITLYGDTTYEIAMGKERRWVSGVWLRKCEHA